eukprot:scaffold87554_cov32-Tisochrysis_lutea.AAC.4
MSVAHQCQCGRQVARTRSNIQDAENIIPFRRPGACTPGHEVRREPIGRGLSSYAYWRASAEVKDARSSAANTWRAMGWHSRPRRSSSCPSCCWLAGGGAAWPSEAATSKSGGRRPWSVWTTGALGSRSPVSQRARPTVQRALAARAGGGRSIKQSRPRSRRRRGCCCLSLSFTRRAKFFRITGVLFSCL